MKRYKHNLSHYKLLTCDMGKLVPIACYEVLPGDSVQQSTSLLLRVSPLLAPVMHPVSVRVHHWFVPNRLLWDGWEDFITGGTDGLGDGVGTPPVFTLNPGDNTKGTLLDYLGVPPGVSGFNVSQFPSLAYNLIYNEFYRDQDLCPEISGTGLPANVAWEKDYFTTCRPWPQRGPTITLPLGQKAPVRGIGKNTGVFPDGARPVFEAGGVNANYASSAGIDGTSADQQFYVEQDVDHPGYPGIYADLSNATAVDVNDVRRAFALQRYAEARAMYGARYTEYLRYLGVRSSDARLQRPEYLGGGKTNISFSEVLQTGPDALDEVEESQGVANLRGHGISALRSRRYRRFFEEHGIVMSLLSVRPRTMYSEGLTKMWSRTTKEDYWQKELEHIGQQEVFNREVYAQADPAGAGVFGYNDRYAEYRHMFSQTAGDFRDTLNFWHLARSFAAPPALNQSFVECDPSKRIHAVQSEDVLWIMASHSIQARRPVTSNTSHRII